MESSLDENVALLSELFPDQDLEFILNSFLQHDGNMDETIKSLLNYEPDPITNPFDHLVNTFPEVEIEAIEAFLLTRESHKSDNLELITREFMKQTTGPSKPRDRPLKMKLSDFGALLKTSNEHVRIYKKKEFTFTFLEGDDDRALYDRLEDRIATEVRGMSTDLQEERIKQLQRATSSFKSGNLTGRSAASFYSDEGQSLAPKIARLNRVAAEKIYREKNANSRRCLDLHHLTVSEAQEVTRAFLDFYTDERVQIITGRGIHSENGTCKLSTAIWSLLRQLKHDQDQDLVTLMKKEFFKLLQLLKEDKLVASDAVECIELYNAVRASSIFSSNEDSSDINPSYIKYVLVDFILASLYESFNCNRLDSLKTAHELYINFLYKSIQYDLISKNISEYSEISRYLLIDQDEDDVRKERFEKWLKLVPRDVKIDRMKRIMRLKNYVIPSECDQNEEDDNDVDEIYSVVWMEIIEFYVLMAVDRLGMLLRELELLESGQEVDVPIPIIFDSNNRKTSTKIGKPFKLVKDRKQVADGIFKYGHNLPTMTIDEYLDLEHKRGNIISGGGAASVVKKEIDEDDEVAMEIELKKARDFDEVKDMYARGSGNTYNRS